jgi:hypothetical protein
MYGWLWARLPGPVAVKVLLALLLFLGVVLVLFLWVFPAVLPLLPLSDPTIDAAAATAPAFPHA